MTLTLGSCWPWPLAVDAMLCIVCPDVIYLRSWICLVERNGKMGLVWRLSIPVDGPHIFTGSTTR